MNQSELEANTCNQRHARENACEHVAIGLGFHFWLDEKVGRNDWTKQRAKKSETKAKRELFWTLDWKPLCDKMNTYKIDIYELRV